MEFTPVVMVAIMGLGTTELIVILVILLVLFGGAKLPGLAKGLGQSIKEFKKATNDEAPKAETSEAASSETKQPEDKDPEKTA